ncbi:hypothetical protein DPSP01_005045 [Paraphaeosphaeria sporulosa]
MLYKGGSDLAQKTQAGFPQQEQLGAPQSFASSSQPPVQYQQYRMGRSSAQTGHLNVQTHVAAPASPQVNVAVQMQALAVLAWHTALKAQSAPLSTVIYSSNYAPAGQQTPQQPLVTMAQIASCAAPGLNVPGYQLSNLKPFDGHRKFIDFSTKLP